MFIVLEGLDGSGTTTQLNLIKQKLESIGHKVFITSEPSNSFIGQKVRKILRKRTRINNYLLLLLFTLDRFLHLQKEIKPALKNNYIVICDRYVYSSIAYQGIFCNKTIVKLLNSFFLNADLTIYFNVTLEESVKRRNHRNSGIELFEKDNIQKQALSNFQDLLKQNKMISVNAMENIDALTDLCLKDILKNKILTK